MKDKKRIISPHVYVINQHALFGGLCHDQLVTTFRQVYFSLNAQWIGDYLTHAFQSIVKL